MKDWQGRRNDSQRYVVPLDEESRASARQRGFPLGLEKGLQEPPRPHMAGTGCWMSLPLLVWFPADQWPLSVMRARLFQLAF